MLSTDTCVLQWKLQSSWMLAVEDHACPQALLEGLCTTVHYSILQRQLINILDVIAVSFLNCAKQTQVTVSF